MPYLELPSRNDVVSTTTQLGHSVCQPLRLGCCFRRLLLKLLCFGLEASMLFREPVRTARLVVALCLGPVALPSMLVALLAKSF